MFTVFPRNGLGAPSLLLIPPLTFIGIDIYVSLGRAMVTIKDIARELNLSYATVSLALNDSPLVKKETAKKVKEVTQKMGYRPNAIARGLVLQRSGIIGIIVPEISNPFFASIARGAEEAAVKRGFNLLICNTDWRKELESQHLRLIQEKKVDGLIIVSIDSKNRVLEELIAQNWPLVFTSSSYPSTDLSFVGVDSLRGGYLVGKHLADLGHTKIAFVGGMLNSESVRSRYSGFKKALEERDIDFDEALTLEGTFSIESGYRNASVLMKKFPGVTAAFAADDLIAIGMIKAFAEKGVPVPEKFSIVGYDDIFISELPGIELTTVFQEKQLMGKLAADLLLDQIDTDKQSLSEQKRIIRLSPRLIVRKTTGPVPVTY